MKICSKKGKILGNDKHKVFYLTFFIVNVNFRFTIKTNQLKIS